MISISGTAYFSMVGNDQGRVAFHGDDISTNYRLFRIRKAGFGWLVGGVEWITMEKFLSKKKKPEVSPSDSKKVALRFLLIFMGMVEIIWDVFFRC